MVKGEEKREGGMDGGVGVDVGRGGVHKSGLLYIVHFSLCLLMAHWRIFTKTRGLIDH